MTATDINPEARGKAHYTLFEDIEDGRSVSDMNSKTEASSEISDAEIRESSSEKHEQEQEEEGTNAKKNTPAVSSGPQVHPPPKKEYGYQWNWDSEAKDYTQVIDGVTVCYREYQRTGGSTPSRSQTLPPAAAPSQVKSEGQEGEPPNKKPSSDSQGGPAISTEKDIEDEYVKVSRDPEAEKSMPSSRQGSISRPGPPPKPIIKEYEEPLDEGFTIVDKPKRFFQVGRIFATVWFEPSGETPLGRKPDIEWTKDCPKYHDEKPIAKFRWFVVVRKRLHHSLCFNITTIGPKGPRKADRGRGQDFVVLHNSNVEPSKPFEVEGITRDPIAVIIEAGEESISPWARLDCGRIYTVEDHLRVMKIGRVHTASLPLLDKYFKESVE